MKLPHMRFSRKGMALGVAAVGLVGAVAGGAGIAQAADGSATTPAATSSSGDHGRGFGMGGMAFGMRNADGKHSAMTAAANYLGISESNLQSQIRSGKSLADIAKTQGKSVNGLKDAMIAAIKSDIESNTSLTAEQKSTMLARMQTRIDTMINQSRTTGDHAGHWGQMAGHGAGHRGAMANQDAG